MWEKQILNAKDKFADVFSLPKDMINNATLVHLIGNTDVIIENYRGIILYTCDEIIIKGCYNKISVFGSCLQIQYYAEDDMKISGKIFQISYN